MSLKYQEAYDKLLHRFSSLFVHVEANVSRAVLGVGSQDAEAEGKVTAQDRKIDEWETKIEESCLNLIATHHPVAGDLRNIVAILKINTDLEHIGDLAVSVSKKIKEVEALSPDYQDKIDEMRDRVLSMLKDLHTSFIQRDAEMAHRVYQLDHEVDLLEDSGKASIFSDLQASTDAFESKLALLSILRQLERIGDLCSNIAENIYYMIKGTIIRHKQW